MKRSVVSDSRQLEMLPDGIKDYGNLDLIQPAFTCSKFAKEALEQGVKYIQS